MCSSTASIAGDEHSWLELKVNSRLACSLPAICPLNSQLREKREKLGFMVPVKSPSPSRNLSFATACNLKCLSLSRNFARHICFKTIATVLSRASFFFRQTFAYLRCVYRRARGTCARQVKPENCAGQLHFRVGSIDTSAFYLAKFRVSRPRPRCVCSLHSDSEKAGTVVSRVREKSDYDRSWNVKFSRQTSIKRNHICPN